MAISRRSLRCEFFARRPLLPVEERVRDLQLAVIDYQIRLKGFRPRSATDALLARECVKHAGRLLSGIAVELPPDLRPRLAPFSAAGEHTLRNMGTCPNPGMVLDEYLNSLRDGLMLVQEELSLRTSRSAVYAA
jgi:hypothetical protein